MNPMETAPRDGREVVLRLGGTALHMVARYFEFGGGYTWRDGQGSLWGDWHFTGWLPLPTEDQAKRIEELERQVSDDRALHAKSLSLLRKWKAIARRYEKHVADLERQLTELRASMEAK